MTYLYGLMNGQTAVPKTLFHNDCYFLLVLRFKILANPIWPTTIVRMHITTCMVLTYAPGFFSCQWTHHLWQTKKSRSSKSSLPLLAANIDQPAHTKTMAKQWPNMAKQRWRKGFKFVFPFLNTTGFPWFPGFLAYFPQNQRSHQVSSIGLRISRQTLRRWWRRVFRFFRLFRLRLRRGFWFQKVPLLFKER